MIKVLVLITVLMFPSVCRGDIATGLVGWWKFEEGLGTSTADSSGSGYTGTLSNGPLWVSGKKDNYALSFDGSNDYVDTSFNIDAEPVTINMWVYVIDDIGPGCVVCTDNGSWDKGIEVATGTWQVHVGNNLVDTAVAVTKNAWTHISLIYTASSMELYLNGSSVWTAGAPGADAGSNITIGHADWPTNGVGTRHFSGYIDDVRVYNRALSSADVFELYTGAVNLRSGLVGWWKLDEGTGTSAADSSGNANTGTLTNGPLWAGGRLNGAVSFDGTNDYIDIANENNFDFEYNNAFSVSCWANFFAFANSDMVLISKLGSAPDNYIGWEFSVFPPGNVIHAYIINSFPGVAISTKGSAALTTGKWYHLVMTYSGSGTAAGVKFYVDGVLESNTVGNDSLAGNTILNNKHVFIGERPSPEWPVNAIIDDVRIYNRALSVEEISTLYTAKSSIKNAKIRNAKLNF